MSQTYTQAIAAARERYKIAMDEAAADVLLIVEQYGKPRATVCRAIAGDDGWNALDIRTRRLAKSAGQDLDQLRRRREAETKRKAVASAKTALKDPEEAAKVMAKLTPTQIENVLGAVAHVQKSTKPSSRPAPSSTSTSLNGAALVALADMATAAKRANELADYGSLTQHQKANAEVAIRAAEAELTVWREQVGGGISDEAIRRLTGV